MLSLTRIAKLGPSRPAGRFKELIKRCDKKSTAILNCLEKDGFYKDSNVKISFDQIPEIEM
ncbi:MAG: hypothetical protein JRI86_11670 [Deltaproteobacteria bacterium]|jgi:hypothetical protein|nr:hypothetical protein [Deltaproteobacteria bacterium]